MAESNLNDKLNALHAELGQTQPTSRTEPVVNDLKQHIQPLVDNPNAQDTQRYSSLRERLNLALVDLEVDHPTLSTAIQSVLNELAAVGI